MSMDAGGLAQMTYNFQNNGIGMPGAGFGARRNGSQLNSKRLSLASAPKVASISENQESVQTPRTSRSHLLAGLRTAPKASVGSVPASAPYHQTQHRFGLDQSRYAGNNAYNAVPQTATAATFGGHEQYDPNQMYSLPEQVLAPTQVQIAADEQLDPTYLAQLMATELFLEERRKQLQRQLLQLTNGAMSMNTAGLQGANANQMNYYGQQQFANNMIQQDAQGNLFMYNPATGQYQYIMDPNAQQIGLSHSPPPPTPGFSSSPPKVGTPTFRAEITPPEEKVNPFTRTASPPKKSSTPPVEVTPLPPPSANAFRPGHKKVPSRLSFNSSEPVADAPRTAFARSCIPQTPATGTFGPGQARAGEHPTRQPRGPPSIDELRSKPTSKQEGSKNFAARQRRRALSSLVRAGAERRGLRTGSAGSMTPVSETEMSFPVSSDSESDGGRSANVSGKPSVSSLRSAATRAIGSERKELQRNRSSVENFCSANSISSDEGNTIGGKLVEVKVEDPKPTLERRVTPKLVLTSAEKRKSGLF